MYIESTMNMLCGVRTEARTPLKRCFEVVNLSNASQESVPCSFVLLLKIPWPWDIAISRARL